MSRQGDADPQDLGILQPGSADGLPDQRAQKGPIGRRAVKAAAFAEGTQHLAPQIQGHGRHLAAGDIQTDGGSRPADQGVGGGPAAAGAADGPRPADQPQGGQLLQVLRHRGQGQPQRGRDLLPGPFSALPEQREHRPAIFPPDLIFCIWMHKRPPFWWNYTRKALYFFCEILRFWLIFSNSASAA